LTCGWDSGTRGGWDGLRISDRQRRAGRRQADLQFVRLYRALGVRQDAEWGRLMA